MDMPSSSTAPSNETDADNSEKDVPMEVVKIDESDVVKMSIDGLDTENEETVVMTVEEVQNYIQSKVAEYMRDPNFNPLLVLRNQVTTLHEKIKQKNEEIHKLNRMFEVLYRDQVKFLRHIGVMPKIEAKTVAVSVDLPWLPDSVPGLLREGDFKAKTLSENLSMQNKANANSTVPPMKKESMRKESTGPVECIDLTDDADTPDVSTSVLTSVQHPAPLPPLPPTSDASTTPPKPRLKLSVDKNGIVLQWDLPPPGKNMRVISFEIFGYQEKPNTTASSSLWKKIGCVCPMTLPMSCTLTQFVENCKYHFSVRAVGPGEKYGYFSDPASIMFTKKANS